MTEAARRAIEGTLTWRRDMVAVGAVAIVAVAASSLLLDGPAAALGRFAGTAVLCWLAIAGFITTRCGVAGLVVQLPDILGDFHALSRFPVRLRVGNAGRRWPALFVTVSIETYAEGRSLISPPVFIARLAVSETTQCDWIITARARGAFEIVGARLTALFPGSPVGVAGVAPLPRRLLALPAVYRLDLRVLELLKGLRLDAGRLHAVPAAAEEFTGVRLYRPGDNPRHVHAALSLRVADYPLQLVVREFEDPSAEDVCIVLDNVLSGEEAQDITHLYRREKAISFTMALCRLLCERKYGVRFRTVDERGADVVFALRRPSRDLPRLETRLAGLAPGRSRAGIPAILQQEARTSNAAILLVSLRDTRIERVNPRLPVVTVTPDMQTALTHEVVAA